MRVRVPPSAPNTMKTYKRTVLFRWMAGLTRYRAVLTATGVIRIEQRGISWFVETELRDYGTERGFYELLMKTPAAKKAKRTKNR